MAAYYSGPLSDHFDGVRFFNPSYPSTDRSLFQLLRWKLGGSRSHWSKAPPARQTAPAPRVAGLSVTLVGHATVLIQLAGLNLLVDPVWSERASPVGWTGPRRIDAPGIAFEDLPPIDAVLVTHNHYDHLDGATLGRLWAAHRPRIIAPLGNDRVIARAAGKFPVTAADWEEAVALGGESRVWIVRANHWSARWLSDRREALWGGFLVETPAGSVYVSGDTGYGDGMIFRGLRERHGAPDVAILPIGAYAPRWFMKAQHVNPEEAVSIMLDTGARHALGVHWGTFQLTDEPRNEPVEQLAQALERHGLPPDRFVALRPGDVWTG